MDIFTDSLAYVLVFLSSFLLGALTLLGYVLSRMMRNPGWDDSNITNALRVLSHVTLHTEDFGKMYYVYEDTSGVIQTSHRPFWYVSKDELSEVVKTRP